MKLGKITLDGKEYPLCFSLRVVKACGDRYGSIGGIDTALTPKADDDGSAIGVINECIWLLSTMMDAGYRYSVKMGLDSPKPPAEDDILDTCDISDIGALKANLMETIVGNSVRTVEADGSKKDGATTET